MLDLLIVEDEDAFRDFMSLALKMEGYRVKTAATGSEALDLLQDARPDLVILDLSMPQISGWDILQFIRGEPELCKIPVVILTANADEDTRRRAMQERVDALLVKPVRLDEILDVLQNLLD
ncbi:MAG: response regulator [Anaerolineae bacterium]|nr:response regulator [Anaerolineae bacterium]